LVGPEGARIAHLVVDVEVPLRRNLRHVRPDLARRLDERDVEPFRHRAVRVELADELGVRHARRMVRRRSLADRLRVIQDVHARMLLERWRRPCPVEHDDDVGVAADVRQHVLDRRSKELLIARRDQHRQIHQRTTHAHDGERSPVSTNQRSMPCVATHASTASLTWPTLERPKS
jgi:hypothetical protein